MVKGSRFCYTYSTRISVNATLSPEGTSLQWINFNSSHPLSSEYSGFHQLSLVLPHLVLAGWMIEYSLKGAKRVGFPLFFLVNHFNGSFHRVTVSFNIKRYRIKCKLKRLPRYGCFEVIPL